MISQITKSFGAWDIASINRIIPIIGIVFAAMMISPSVAKTAYKLGPGDIIQTKIWNEEDLSGTFAISPKGNINFFYVGEVKVAGMTVPEVEVSLTKILAAGYIKNPRVAVSVKEYNSQKVYLLGKVAKPGKHTLKEDPSLLKVLLEVGGPLAEAGSSLTLIRTEHKDKDKPQTKNRTIDLKTLMGNGDMSQNISLQNGDILFIHGRDGSQIFGKNKSDIKVVGEVKRPGSYPYREGLTVLDAILEAQGFTDFADKNGTRIVRGDGANQETIIVKMNDVIKKGDKTKNIDLKPGDILIVPEGGFF